jgi:hypothetical protein
MSGAKKARVSSHLSGELLALERNRHSTVAILFVLVINALVGFATEWQSTVAPWRLGRVSRVTISLISLS